MSPRTQPSNDPYYGPLHIVLAAETALAGVVIEQLRAVSVTADPDMIRLYFVYEGNPDEDELEEWSCAGTELHASYPSSAGGLDVVCERIPAPGPINIPGVLVYLRREDPPQQAAIVRGAMIQEVLTNAPPTRPYILYATNRALLGEVTPNLRYVLVDWTEPTIHIAFYYDGPITDQDAATAARVAGRVQSWLTGAQVNAFVERLDYPNKIPLFPQDGKTRVAVYARYELLTAR
ncbi:MAG: hypothetical protein ACOYKZ_03750 [Chlamydiia bacterium]